ncbi:uncharacterized protein LOC110250098, partial [Exaiptasia diaphana]|uniref:RNase H type-1 domain-containing protein n=1 Tax=Exaiptasia diaphana TaxID=2652724 RepID=A0A913XZY6_EXADI
QAKVQKIVDRCNQTLNRKNITLRQLASLIGLLESTRPAICRAPLHFRHLQIDQIKGLQVNQKSYEALAKLSRDSRQEVSWWLKNIHKVNGSPIHPPSPDVTITTDASKKGWGAVQGCLSTNGKWSEQETKMHINYLELKAAFLALQSFLKDKSHQNVSLRMDNTTAIAYVNNKGGTRSPQLLALALELWEWCLAKEILVTASHIPGLENTMADSESREFKDMSEWKLDASTIQPFLKTCRTDLFASRLTHQLKNYISWRPDPGAIHTDALTIHWGPLKGYAFPPFNLVAKTLEKVISDQTEIILVAPVWQAQPWWPVLLRLLVAHPIVLPNSPTLLTDAADRMIVHPMFPRLHLAVFHVSTNISSQRVFHQTLQNFSSQPLDPPHVVHTNQAGSAGVAGVVNGKLIPFQHL